jgi:hypothetical protein
MKDYRGIILSTALLLLMACADHGTAPQATNIDDSQGGIAFSILKTETPAEIWVIEARLEREGFPPLKQSVSARTATDTIRILISGIASGAWKVTVDAKDSTGAVRYSGSSSVQIIGGQTAQAYVQMNPTSVTGSLQIVVTWPMLSKLQVRVVGGIFVTSQSIPVSVTNVSAEVVYPQSCCLRPDLRIQQRINGGWTPPGACELMCPTALEPMKPGTRIVDSVIRISEPGLYRLLLRYWTLTSSGGTLFSETFSNEFNVVGQRKDSVRLGEEFVLRFGDQVSVQGAKLSLKFQDVTEDSRCADGVVCVWEGNAKVLLTVNQSIFALNTTVEPRQIIVDRYLVRLNSLSPYPMIERKIQKADYLAALIVSPI